MKNKTGGALNAMRVLRGMWWEINSILHFFQVNFFF